MHSPAVILVIALLSGASLAQAAGNAGSSGLPGGGASAAAGGGNGHSGAGSSHSGGGHGPNEGGDRSGGTRAGDGWHGIYVVGRNGAPSGVRESFGGKEAIFSRETIGGKDSVLATLRGKLSPADQRRLIKAGWWRHRENLTREPEGDFLCRVLPAHSVESFYPADGYFCVVAPGPYATTP